MANSGGTKIQAYGFHKAHQIEAKTDEWHEICKVEGYVNIIGRESGKHGLIYTDEPTKLIITEVLPQFVPPIPAMVEERRILKNAERVIKMFSR